MENLDFIKTLPKDKIICGSYVLFRLNIIKRDFTDYDIILRIEEFEKYSNLDTEQIIGKYNFENNNKLKIISYIFKDGSKCDLFFRDDFEKLEIKIVNDLLGDNIMFLHPTEIMYEKVNLIRQKKDINKHISDIEQILKYIKPEELPF